MAGPLGKITWTGISGTTYEMHCHPIGTNHAYPVDTHRY